MTHLGAVKKKKDTDRIGGIIIIVIIFKTQGKKINTRSSCGNVTHLYLLVLSFSCS